MSTSPPPAASVILVADDDRVARDLLQSTLRAGGYTVEVAADGQEVIERVARGGISLLVLDVMMPKLNGLEVCRIVKAVDPEAFLPVILCTARTDLESRIEGLRLGADDYICKPFDARELMARAGAMLRIKEQSDAVRESRSKLEQLATHDERTGLYNYRYLVARLAEEFKRAERFHEPLAALMLDLDEFKAMNDAYGHPFGDQALRAVAHRLRKGVRDIDVVTRYGGDEFLVLLPNTHLGGAVAVADRLWRDITSTSLQVDGTDHWVQLQASIGVAVFPSRDVRSKDAFLRAADQALYAAKRSGRNRIFVAANQGYLYDTSSPHALSRPPPPGSQRGTTRTSDVPPSRDSG